ncbi:hypothetical protein [Synechococcus sp. W4D4]|uniref:hypothetical protein n=1 Tax=Synechococcus sp. W4D4 TaxID=3392294 RepID=UPI0039ECC28C
MNAFLVDVGGSSCKTSRWVNGTKEWSQVHHWTEAKKSKEEFIHSLIEIELKSHRHGKLVVGLPGPVTSEPSVYCPPIAKEIDVASLRNKGCIVVNDVVCQMMFLPQEKNCNQALVTVGTSLGLAVRSKEIERFEFSEEYIRSYEIAHERLDEWCDRELSEWCPKVLRDDARLCTIFSAAGFASRWSVDVERQGYILNARPDGIRKALRKIRAENAEAEVAKWALSLHKAVNRYLKANNEDRGNREVYISGGLVNALVEFRMANILSKYFHIVGLDSNKECSDC